MTKPHETQYDLLTNRFPPSPVPTKKDGTEYRYYLSDGVKRLYCADDIDVLMEALVPGWVGMNQGERTDALTLLAMEQVKKMRLLLPSVPGFDKLSKWEQECVKGTYNSDSGMGAVYGFGKEKNQEIDVWDPEPAFPLVILDRHYAPFSAIPAPLESEFANTETVIVISSVSPLKYLQSISKINQVFKDNSSSEWTRNPRPGMIQ